MTQKVESSFLWLHKVGMPILMLVLTAMVSIFGFIGNKVWHRVESSLNSIDYRVDTLEIESARTDANRFTSQHWSEAKSQIDEDRGTLDRRVTRLEESIPQIKESLTRIEDKLDAIQQ